MTKLRGVPLLALFSLIYFTQAQLVQDRKKDIVFLIDGSDNVGNTNFLRIREFILKIINKFQIGSDSVRVAVVQYSEQPKTEFYLSSYASKGELQPIVKQLRSKGGSGRNTGAALDYVLRNHFVKSAGSRKEDGVPQFLVLVTGGQSQDSIRLPAFELKQAAIMTLAVGVGDVSQTEMEEIAFGPFLVFEVSNFQELIQKHKDVQAKISALGVPTVITETPTVTITEVVTEVVNKRDIVFLIDGSANVGNAYFPVLRDFIRRIIDTLNIGRDSVQVAVAQYSNDVRTEFYLNSHSTKAEVVSHINRLRLKGGRTLNTGAALGSVLVNLFTKSTGSRREDGVPQMLLVVTAGRSEDDVRPPAEALAQGGILTIAIGISKAEEAELQRIAFNEKVAYRVNDFNALEDIRETVEFSVRTLIHGGVTVVPPAMKKDIVFLIDGSPAMGRSFLQVREFLTKVIQELDVGPDKDQVAVVQYSSDSRVEFGLDTYSTRDQVLDALKRLGLKTGRPLNTGAALDFVTKSVFSPSAGSRRLTGASQILVLITAGKSRDDVRRAADAVKQAGIVPIAIGAKSADISELQQIVHEPKFVLTMRDFQDLSTIQQELLSKMRTVIIFEEPIEERRDVVFLIDGSDKVESAFPMIKQFVSRIVDTLDVGRDRVQVCVVQYSDDPSPNFYLNSYTSKAEVMQAISALGLKGGTQVNTGEALDYVTKNVFTRSAGSRMEEGVPQFLILLTASKSSDDVTQAAVALKGAGVAPFSIGSRDADEDELRQISLSPHFVFRVDDLQNVETIHQNLESPLKQLNQENILTIYANVAQDAVKRDVVFLVDGSEKVRAAFPSVQRFISRIVDQLDIGSDKVRFGLVQYSDDSRVNFYLNSHTTKREVKEAINNLRQIGGRRTNTGAALDYVTKNIFTRSAGSRVEEGVPQFLILLTASKSSDDVGQAALALKQAGVAPFSIGSGDADDYELQQISLSPDYIFKVNDLRNVETVQQRLESPLTTLNRDRIIRIRTRVLGDAVKRDVVFLVDGSEKVRAAFPSVQRFLSKVVDTLDVGSDKIRVGLVQYSDDSRVNFYLNSHTTKQDVKEAINNLRQIGGRRTNTGAALDYVTKNIFTRSAGSRVEEGVPQFLILLTASKSSDDVGQAALALKQAGVAPFSIGSGDADDYELQQISLSPDYIFKVDDLRNVETVQQRLESPLTTLNRDRIIRIRTRVLGDAVKRDVVFLVDGSEKVRAAFPSVQRFLSKVVNTLDVGSDKIRVGVVQYSDDPRVNFYLNSHTTKQDVEEAINNLRQIGGRRTNTGAALDYVTKNIFTRSAGSRVEEGVPQFLILLTASKSSDDVGQAALALKQAGVAPFSIGSGDADDDELQQISLSPDYIFKVDDLRNVETVQQRLESPLTTLNRDRIVRIRTRVLGDAVKRDVVFLVDGSEKVRAAFPSVQRFLSKVVDTLDVGSDKIRVGVVQYSDDPRVNFYLNSHTTKQDVKEAINNLRQIGGRRTNTGAALDHVTKNIFTRSAGSRVEEGVPQFLILLTASKSSDDVGQAALALKQAGVAPFSIGSGDTDDDELQQISLSPDYIFKVDDLRNVETVQQRLESPLTTLNRDRIVRIRTRVLGDAVKRDVVFLVDGSEKVRAAFPSVQRFLSKVVDTLDVGSDKIRVGVVQYSDDPRVNFYLNSHTTKQDVKEAINNLRQIGGRRTNTGAALDYVTKNIFTRSAGSRVEEGVPQFLILLTASKSSDDVGQAALALKQAGVAPFSIGSGDADDDELQQISLSPDYIFKVDDLRNVETVQQRLESPLTTLNRDRIVRIRTRVLGDAVKRDVVFLVDGSEKVRAAFPSVQRFLSKVVDSFDVGSDKIRVGVVQYSDDPRVNFYLNSHTTKQDVKEAINNLRQIGGRRTNTGAALDYVTKNIFTRSAGSRVEEGVPQFLILLTASKSSDNVGQAALALKQAGVAPFSIGSGDADDDELQQISLSPDYIFKVDDLRNVETVQQRLESPLTTLNRDRIIRIRTRVLGDAAKRDVVFLVEGSDKVRTAFPAIKNFISGVVDNLDVESDRARVSVAQYSDDPRVNFFLNTYTTKDDVKQAVGNLRHKGGRRVNTGQALDYVTNNVFTGSAGSRVGEGVPQFLILLTASKSSDDVSRAALALKQAGVAPFSIGSRDTDDDELQQISLSPDYIFKVDDLRNVATVQQRLESPLITLNRDQIIRISNDAPEVPSPVPQMPKRDIVFLVDGSDSAETTFPLVKNFIARVAENLDIGRDRIRVGIVQYGDNPTSEFLLNTYARKSDVMGAIRNLRHKGGRETNTGKALDYVTNNVFTRSGGSRMAEGVPQFLILLTAGKSTDDVKRAALALKQAGVAPFSIGTRGADPTELQQISLSPDYVFKFDDIQDIQTIKQHLIVPLTDLGNDRIIELRDAEVPDSVRRDIVFLLDGSNTAGPTFPAVRSFISKTIENLDIGIDKVRVGVVQYSDNPNVEFLLNAYTTKPEVQAAVRNLKLKGGRNINIGKALNYVTNNLFTKSAGSRIQEDVPQFLILLTAGKSNDQVNRASLALKQAGVAPFIIGSRDADDDELRQISLSPDYIFRVNDLRNVQSIQQRLLVPLSTLNTDQIKEIRKINPTNPSDTVKKDVVFLIDGSSNVGAEDFAHIRDFVLNIINSLDVGANKVRVGLAQFSNNGKTEFLLKQHSNKGTLHNNIRRIRPKGGAPLNIGRGLDFVLKNHFTRSAGSRRQDGVPQYLIVINGGKSNDDISPYIGQLKNFGITAFGVGTKDSDEDELERISNIPYATYVVNNFQDLKSVQDTLRFRLLMEDPTTYETPEPPTEVLPQKKVDIVFLLDGSINIGRQNFHYLTEFVNNIVDAIYVDDESLQVGVVQYNSDVSDEFFLNTYKTRDDVLKAIEDIQFKGGRTLNTGAALRHVKNAHFIKSAGSRIEEGVPQIAFLLIGGKSNDDAIAAARELKNARFKIFTVGMQDADLQEITQLATETAGVFRVADMSSLSELTEQVLLATTDVIAGELCPKIPETVKGCNVDVLLGFDVSTVGFGNDVFATQRGLESKAGDVLQRISQLRTISCTGTQSPSVRVGVMVFNQVGQPHIIDLVEYQPEIMTAFSKLRNFGPYVLNAGTLDAYRDTFKSVNSDHVKVIVHFTDGIDDNFSTLQRQAENLRREGSIHALLIVSLEKLTGLEDISLLEFGRGFRYRRPLSINQLDLEYELAEELDNIAERVCCDVPCKCAGQPGDKGPQGPRGQKGSPGPKGIIGHPGDEGGPGERGPPGVNGTQGFQGCQGQSGSKGTRGYPGDKGQLGELGLDGIDGEQGSNGVTGPPGERGNLGAWGAKGTKGGEGERGELGYRGDPGEPGTTNNQNGLKGQRGDMGLVGDSGESGRPGSLGQPGSRGSQGRRGSPGARGTKGNAGTLGPPGVSGFRGQQGTQGSLGIPGREGGSGIRGPRGSAGPVAPSGARGKIGLNGRKGEPGNPGDKGEIGPTGPRGEMGEDGKNGIGNPGPNGRKGERGPVGPPGPKGEFGISGVLGKDGIKGNRGRRGYSGASGEIGFNGEIGYPGSQGPKGERGRSMEICSLVRQIKDTCPCCYGAKECPIYPTELAFVIDTSNSKTVLQLNNNKNAILNIVRNLTIVESNCPKGARVALLTYNSGVITEIRFSSARNKRDLIKQIEDLKFVPSRKESSIAEAMNFVARNTFKRVRSGFLMRKVAIFFTDGQTKPKELNDAITKLANENIISVYLSPKDDNVLTRALQKNDAGLSQFFVFRNDAATLDKVMACHVCLDFCEANGICDAKFFRSKRSIQPSDVDLDIAFIIDSSATINPNQFIEIKRYISYMMDHLEISKEPTTSIHQARIAVVQHALYHSQTNNSLERVKVEFSLTDYTSSGDIRGYIQNKMTQLDGTKATAHAIEWSIKNIFEKAPQPRPHKLIILMTTGDLPESEREKLEAVITDAKCKGFFFVIFNIVKKSNEKDLIYLASAPQDVFFKPINEISELHSEDLLRFGRLLPKYINAENAFHLPPELQKLCELFQSDQPSSEAFRNPHNQDTNDAPVDSGKLMGMELSASSVTEDSIILHWAQTEPQHIDNYEVTVIKVSQNILVLKMNVSDAEIVLKDLENGQQYNVTVIGFYQSNAKSIYNGTFTTKRSPEIIAKSKTVHTTMEPLENPEIDRCMLDFDAGSQCSEYSAKWFFDNKNNICTQFWYGGCDGNGNRFDTEAECIAECTKPMPEESISQPKLEGITLSVRDICQLRRDEGTCRNFSLKWYYDVKTELCTRFWFGGCDGNENRFNTQDECTRTCVEGRLQTRIVSAMGT
ncbi:collagen alpha-3(VI) chain-like [Heptranchias perlo]|uniref:collagen alpha-3(VI) chain-like n=1 Tax=Heptranchias perlo TaxID=212740 RepID=UPI003559C57C